MKIFFNVGRDAFLPLLLGAAIGSMPPSSVAHSVVLWAETTDDHVEVETLLSDGVVPKQS